VALVSSSPMFYIYSLLTLLKDLKTSIEQNVRNVNDKDSVIDEDIDEVHIIDEDSVSDESSVSYKHIKSDEV